MYIIDHKQNRNFSTKKKFKTRQKKKFKTRQKKKKKKKKAKKWQHMKSTKINFTKNKPIFTFVLIVFIYDSKKKIQKQLNLFLGLCFEKKKKKKKKKSGNFKKFYFPLFFSQSILIRRSEEEEKENLIEIENEHGNWQHDQSEIQNNCFASNRRCILSILFLR